MDMELKMTTDLFSTLGGRVTCIRGNALSKSYKTRCRAPAVKGKTCAGFMVGALQAPKRPRDGLGLQMQIRCMVGKQRPTGPNTQRV
jgi:hypothetical protein